MGVACDARPSDFASKTEVREYGSLERTTQMIKVATEKHHLVVN